MKKYNAGSIHNVCLLSHSGVGKTTVLEAACYTAGATRKQGKVDNGTSIFDTRPDEKERQMTISMAVGTCEWNNTKINFLDTPGCLDLLGDVQSAMKVVETAVILIDAFAGIQVGTDLVSRVVDRAGVKKIFFINGMDKENVDFDKTLNAIKDSYGSSVAPLQIPIGTGANFKGIVDLITKEAYEYAAGGNGKGQKIDIPSELSDKVEIVRGALMEAIAESDEGLLEKYFDAGELSDEEMQRGLAKGVTEGLIFPLICGSGVNNIGTDIFLNTIVKHCPAANARIEVETDDGNSIACSASDPTAAFVFKTLSEEHIGEINVVRVFSGSLSAGKEYLNSTNGQSERLGNMFFLRGQEKIETSEITTGDIGALLKLKDTHTNNTITDKSRKITLVPIQFDEPLVRVAINAKEKGDEEKISTGLKKLMEEDPTFTYNFQSDIRQSILSTRGDIQAEILLDMVEKRFKINIEKKQPKVSYRETVTKTVKYIEYTHKKQTGGAGQYARVFIDLEPKERGGEYEFVDKIVGGVIDQSLRPSVDKGVRAIVMEGIIAGYPIVDIRVSLVDGKTHPVDSKDIAFQVAGKKVFKKAFEMAAPILLEPIVDLKVSVPEGFTGDVMGDLSSRRGKIGGMNPEGKYQTISAKVPAAELLTYSQSLRSMTQGRGFYSTTFSHYDPVPHELTQKIIADAKKDAEESS